MLEYLGMDARCGGVADFRQPPRFDRELVEAPCFSRGSWTSVQRKSVPS